LGSHEDFGRCGRYKTLVSYLKEKVLTPALFLWYNIIKERRKKELIMRDAYDLEGYSVFALMIQFENEKEELWGIYSNAKACCDNGEKICKGFCEQGKDAWYYCRSFDVKGE
jgi:hypothetical protein